MIKTFEGFSGFMYRLASSELGNEKASKKNCSVHLGACVKLSSLSNANCYEFPASEI